MDPVEEFTTIESIFVRHRNCLMVRGQFTPIYTDHYLHLMQHGHRYPEDLDQCLKDMLAVLALHLVARPWKEVHAWTANLRAPRVNFFATGSSTHETLVGRLFTEEIRETDRDLLYSQVLEGANQQARNSTLEISGLKPLAWIESYYEQSEQRPCRAFDLGDEEFVLIVAQPDYDEEWLAGLDTEKVRTILDDQETKVLETRKFRFHCGCTLEKILPVLSSWKDRPDELFQGDDSITVTCPRCNANYVVTREAFDNQ